MQAATLESVNAMAWGMAVPGVTCAPDGACPAGTLAVMMCLMEQGPHCAHLEANPGQRAVLLGGSGAGPLCLPCWHERRAELEAYVVKGTRCDGCDASPDEMSTVAYPFGPMTVVGTLCSVCLAVACPSPKERERRWRKRNDS